LDHVPRARGKLANHELSPPTQFYPTTDLFTVLSIVEGAYMAHCCCCLKEPATSAPIRRTRRASYEKPFHAFEKDFDPDEYTYYEDEDNFPDSSAGLPSSNPGIWRRGVMKALREKLKKRAMQGKKARFGDAAIALDLDCDRNTGRSRPGFDDEFRKLWKEARSKAGNPVEDTETEPDEDEAD